jgi:cell division protein FtsW
MVLGGTLVVIGFLQKDYGTALVFACIIGMMLFMAGLPWKYVGAAAGSMVVVGLGVLKMAGNASSRLTAFLDIEGTKKLDGYQVYQALLSISNGGLGGTGLGSGTSKWGYVPLAYSDFIFAVIAEELGFLGAFAVIGGFAVLAYYGIQTALGAREMHGAFIAGGVTAWLSFQVFINIGGIVGVMPMTGLTLPFMSYGGSSLAATMVGCGLLLNVARHMR